MIFAVEGGGALDLSQQNRSVNEIYRKTIYIWARSNVLTTGPAYRPRLAE